MDSVVTTTSLSKFLFLKIELSKFFIKFKQINHNFISEEMWFLKNFVINFF